MSFLNSVHSLTRSILFTLGLGVLSWLLMQVIHECGHVLAALLAGGTVVHVDLHPLRISETIVRPKPHPLFIIWAGPIFGCLLPSLIWLAIRCVKNSSEFVLRFFAGFCLIANGAYLGSGILDPVGDAFDLVQLGTSRWLLGLFGLATLVMGIWLWEGIFRHLGFVRQSRPISWQQVIAVWALLTTLVLAELSFQEPVPQSEKASTVVFCRWKSGFVQFSASESQLDGPGIDMVLEHG